MKCCICNKEIPKVGNWDKGNNAELVTNGRCCNKCNETEVLPVRIKLIRR